MCVCVFIRVCASVCCRFSYSSLRVYVRVYVCMIFACVRMSVNSASVHACVFEYDYAWMHVCVCVSVRVCLCVCVYVCLCVYVYLRRPWCV